MRNKILLFICFSVFFFSSCSKSSSSNSSTAADNTFTATIDGTDMTFNISAQAIVTNQTDAYGITLIGYHDQNTTNPTMMTIMLLGTNAITTGTYTPVSENGGTEATIFFTQGSNAYAADLNNPTTQTVTITSLTSSSVQGTFSGKIVVETGGSGTKTITNGKFNLKIK
jgi:hypothetical protein